MKRRTIQSRHHGAAAVLAMLFLVLMTTLSVAMYTLETTNTQTAYNLTDVNRAQAAAEAGVRWMAYRFSHTIVRPKTLKGAIDAATADTLWQGGSGLQQAIINDLAEATAEISSTLGPAGGIGEAGLNVARIVYNRVDDTSDHRELMRELKVAWKLKMIQDPPLPWTKEADEAGRAELAEDRVRGRVAGAGFPAAGSLCGSTDASVFSRTGGRSGNFARRSSSPPMAST